MLEREKKKISSSQLLPGDVIFFENRYLLDNSSDTVDYTYIDHVTLFTGQYNNPFSSDTDKSLPVIVHSICDGYGHYYPEPVSGLCVTTLIPLRGQVQQLDEPAGNNNNNNKDKEIEEEVTKYDVAYKVFRFIGRDSSSSEAESEQVRQKAMSLLVQQSRYRIPYDDYRLQRKYQREALGWEEKDFVTHAKTVYEQGEGLFRAIKFAARNPKPWTRQSPVLATFASFSGGSKQEEGGKGRNRGRGLTCSMAVVVAYQVAELLIDERVEVSTDNLWPSDKYSQREVNEEAPHGFNEYLHSIRNNQDNTDDKKRLPLCDDDETMAMSYRFWKSDTHQITDYRHCSFAVDCKSIGAEGMFTYMTESSNAWCYLGELEL